MKRLAILIPTYGRTERLPAVVENARHPVAQVYLLMEPQEAVEVDGAVTMTQPGGFGSWAKALTYGYRHTREPLLFPGSDDLNFHAGWFERAVQELSDRILVVGTNDLGNPEVLSGDHSTMPLVDRRYLDETGGVFDEGPGSFMPECYHHNWTDKEFVEVAKLRGIFKPCLESVVEHMHVSWGKALFDATYAKGHETEPLDRETYWARASRFRELAPIAA